MCKCVFNVVALVLIVLGALNWGLWGFFQFDFVAWLFHSNTDWASRIVYSLIGLAGVWGLRFFCKCKSLCCCCKKPDGTCSCCGKKECNCSCKNGSGTCNCCGKNKENCSCKKPEDKGPGGCCKL